MEDRRLLAATLGVNVKAFGATGNGSTDDTAAIQQAINSLEVHSSLVYTNTNVGGVIYLPAGTYRVSSTLHIQSGVVLRGDGGATVINNVDPNAGDAAIEMDPGTDGLNLVMGGGLENLTLKTTAAYGVRAKGAPGLNVLQTRFDNLTLSTGNWSIYLPAADAYSQNNFIRNVHVQNMGAGAVWMEGNANHIEKLYTEGTARSSFASGTTLVRVNGDGTFMQDCIFGGTPSTKGATGCWLSGGSLNWQNNWQKIPTAANGVVYRFSGVEGLVADSLNKLDSSHTASVSASEGVNIAQVTIPTRVALNRVLVADAASSVRVRQVLRGTQSAPQATPTSATTLTGIDASLFGAIPNDQGDDTAALQAALNSAQAGSMVFIPRGVYQLSAPLVVPSGVTLRGEGSGTVLLNSDPNVNDGVLQLAPGTQQGTVIADLTVTSQAGYGISAPGAQISNCRFENLVVSAGNWGIYLPAANGSTSNSVFRNIYQRYYGNGAMWVEGNGNVIDGLDTETGGRAGMQVPSAMLRVNGDSNTIRNCIIEGGSALAYHISGSNLTWRSNWAEMSDSTGLAYWFDGVQGMDADELHLLSMGYRARFTQCSNVMLHVLDTNGDDASMLSELEVDPASSLNIQETIARRDTGALNDPRLKLRGIWSMANPSYVDTATLAGQNLMTNGSFTNGLTGWDVQWGQGMTGTAEVVTGADGVNRLQVTITSNPNNYNVVIQTTAAVPAANVGQVGALAYEIDYSGGAWATSWVTNTMMTRATGSLTAEAIPSLGSSQLVRFIARGTGTATFSNVQLYAAGAASPLHVG